MKNSDNPQADLDNVQERWLDLYDHAPVGYCTVGDNGLIVETNLKAAALLGVAREELVFQTISRFVFKDDLESYHLHSRQLFETGAPQACELRMVKEDGTQFWARLEATVAQGPSTGPEQRMCRMVLSDITGRRKAEEALKESEERFRHMTEQLPDVLFATDNDGIITYISPSVTSMFGWSPEEMIGRRFAGFLQEDEVEKALESHGAAVFTGKPSTGLALNIKRKDGSVFPGELKSSAAMKNGKIVGTQGVIRDITDRKREEEALRASEERYRSILNATPDAVAITDLEGRILMTSPAAYAILGVDPDQKEKILGHLVSEFIVPGDRDRAASNISLMFQGIMTGPGEYKGLHADGSTFEEESNAEFIRDADGRPTGIVFIVRDITERKQHEEEKARLTDQLQQSMKMEAMGRLAGGVAHDFNNLLTSITGNVALALMALDPADPLHVTLTDVNRAADSAATLTKQLLAFSRKQMVEPRVVNLSELVVDLNRMLIRLIGENIELKISTAEDLWSVRVDPGQFEQVIVNMAVNARDAMPDGGKLVIETSNANLDEGYCLLHPYVKPGAFVVLKVSDTGHGISAEVKKHLFEPFFTTKPLGRGTGLGMATIYGAVKQAGGSVEIDSETGTGTTFTIYLPMVMDKAEKLERGGGTQELKGGSETVLLVEDEPMVRNLAIRILKRLGYNVLHAEDGGKALLLAEKRRSPIELLVTDVIMPGIDGSQLADRLKRTHPEMAVLFTSGYTYDILKDHGVTGGAVNFIGKPYSPQTLACKIREVLEKKRL